MNVDAKWIDVVTDPLGLAGFALFLVFLIVCRPAFRSGLPWLAPVFVVLAISALAGGFGLAWKKAEQAAASARSPVTSGPAPISPPPNKPSIQIQTIETKGVGSSVAVGGGNVDQKVDLKLGSEADSAKPKSVDSKK